MTNRGTYILCVFVCALSRELFKYSKCEVFLCCLISREKLLMCISVLDEYCGWKPGVLCPVSRRGAWGDPLRPHLPPAVCYHRQAELQEVAHLSLRVQVLQQETLLQQVRF